MASRRSGNRAVSFKFIKSAVEQQGPDAVSMVQRKLEPYLPEGVAMPDTFLLMQLMIAYLGDLLKKLLGADEALLGELANDVKYRETRDEAAAELIAEYSRKRDTFNGLFGLNTSAEVGFEPRLEYQPDRLALQVERVLNVLESPDFELPETSGALQIDAPGYAAELKPLLKKLSEALTDVERERRDAQIKQLAKDDSMTTYDDGFLPVARLLEAFFLLAGLVKLSQSLRPSQRRPGRRAEEAEDDRRETDDDEPAADEPEGPPAGRPDPPQPGA